jgi:hypothetical protein
VMEVAVAAPGQSAALLAAGIFRVQQVGGAAAFGLGSE